MHVCSPARMYESNILHTFTNMYAYVNACVFVLHLLHFEKVNDISKSIPVKVNLFISETLDTTMFCLSAIVSNQQSVEFECLQPRLPYAVRRNGHVGPVTCVSASTVSAMTSATVRRVMTKDPHAVRDFAKY